MEELIILLFVLGILAFIVYWALKARKLSKSLGHWRVGTQQKNGVEKVYIYRHGSHIPIGQVALNDANYSDKVIGLYSLAEDQANEKNAVAKVRPRNK